jgi:Amt family ammonium transporter
MSGILKVRYIWLRVLLFGVLLAALFVPSLVVFADDGGPTVESVTGAVQSVSMDLNTLWLFVAAFLVFFMQAGFALVETGSPARKTWRIP